MQPLADVPVGREQSLRDLYIFFREGFHFISVKSKKKEKIVPNATPPQSNILRNCAGKVAQATPPPPPAASTSSTRPYLEIVEA